MCYLLLFERVKVIKLEASDNAGGKYLALIDIKCSLELSLLYVRIFHIEDYNI